MSTYLTSDNSASLRLEASWLRVLQDEFHKPYMLELKKFLQKQLAEKKQVFPKPKDFFFAMDMTPLDQVKVVIIGQDPYHGLGQAHGLCFSVNPGVDFPPSLKNIFQELQADLGIPLPTHGGLHHWAEQGVLLLNSVLSVEAGKAASHAGRGWEIFTDQVIQQVNLRDTPMAFVLWGSYAQKKGQWIDRKKHFVLESPHPSPLSAYRGFFGSSPFSKINEFLKKNKIAAIDWRT